MLLTETEKQKDYKDIDLFYRAIFLNGMKRDRVRRHTSVRIEKRKRRGAIQITMIAVGLIGVSLVLVGVIL